MNSREQMVRVIKDKYFLDSPKVLSVMRKVPREKFVPQKYSDIAYNDGPVPINFNQTMSQPYTVAFMTHLLLSDKQEVVGDKVADWKTLEIGTGSGYQAAVLSKLVGKVYTVEIIGELAKQAGKTFKKLGCNNVYVKSGSGEWGWEKHAPYDAILVTAGIEGKVPKALFDQLKEGGVLVAPVGRGYDKRMFKFTKKAGGKIKKKRYGIFHFVPFVKRAS